MLFFVQSLYPCFYRVSVCISDKLPFNRIFCLWGFEKPLGNSSYFCWTFFRLKYVNRFFRFNRETNINNTDNIQNLSLWIGNTHIKGLYHWGRVVKCLKTQMGAWNEIMHRVFFFSALARKIFLRAKGALRIWVKITLDPRGKLLSITGLFGK